MFVLIEFTVYREHKGEKSDDCYETESSESYENMNKNSWHLLTIICQTVSKPFNFFFFHLINTAAQWKGCYFSIAYFTQEKQEIK